jgi:hypothetical protein
MGKQEKNEGKKFFGVLKAKKQLQHLNKLAIFIKSKKSHAKQD